MKALQRIAKKGLTASSKCTLSRPPPPSVFSRPALTRSHFSIRGGHAVVVSFPRQRRYRTLLKPYDVEQAAQAESPSFSPVATPQHPRPPRKPKVKKLFVL